MPTLLVSPRVTPDSEAMLAAARAAGWSALRLERWRAPAGLPAHDLTLYGEPLFADVLAGALGLALLQTPLDWLATLPEQYRQRAVRFTTLGEARAYELPAFIKPADDKCFPARVYASGAELPHAELLPRDTPVLISEVVDWRVEFRCFVAERAVLTCSPYWRDGALAQAADGSWPAPAEECATALAFATTLLADPAVAVAPALVLDVGLIADRGWAVVEANSPWGAGIYGCDAAQVLQVLSHAVVPRATLGAAERVWERALPEVEIDPPIAQPEPDADGLITLYRPVGAQELALIAASGYQAFPPRLAEQPIFYPVLNERYAAEIARAWNTQDDASGHIGHITRFRVRAGALARYRVQIAGAAHHQELWIPAEELAEFNRAIVGLIELIATFEPDTDH